MPLDLCIYGGTASGVIAAVAAAQLGKSVLLIEPGRHLGGMSSGGLGNTDIGNKAAIGGQSRKFYQRIGKHYGKPEQWTFEPHVAERAFEDLIAENRIKVLKEHRLSSVETVHGRIGRVELAHLPADENNAPGADGNLIGYVIVEASMYIDATYEGDLLAAAKVSYTVGRESAAQYDEPLNGIRAHTPKHQFLVPVDPYFKPGDPKSGLLPLIQEGDGGKPGDADQRVQTYNLRLCLTRDAKNQLPMPPPPGYDPARFEVLARHVEGLVASGKSPILDQLMKVDAVPGGKTDINNNGAVSTDFIGANWLYPDGDYATRARIWHEHLIYTRGLLHFIATSDRIPASVRGEMASWRLCRDEFADTGGWPHQMYVREARRMVGSYVVTQAVCEHKVTADDSVGLGAYTMDSHNCQRIVQGGVVRNEGDVQVPAAAPYPISYRAIVPKARECENLLVPICLSASHIAYGSIRMEPVFMVLGESAAVAACWAIDAASSVQDVDVKKLQQVLLDRGQILTWNKGR